MSSLILRAILHPNASRDEIVGFRNDILKVNVTPPPHNGLANDRFIKLLSKKLGLPKSNIKIIRGEKNRNKIVELSNTPFNNIDELKKLLHRKSFK
jgi:hypothetical protein